MTTALRSRALWAAGNWVPRWLVPVDRTPSARGYRRMHTGAVRTSCTACEPDERSPGWHAAVEAPRRGLGRRLSNRSLRSRRTPRARPHLSPQQEIPPPIVLFLHTLALPPLLTRPHPSCSPRERGPPFSLSISFGLSLSLSFSLGGPLLRLAFLLPRLTRRTPRRGSYSCSDDDTG